MRGGVMGVFLLVVGIVCIIYGVTIMLTWSGTAFFLVWYVLGVICGGTGALALALPDSTVVRGVRTAVCCLTVCGIAVVSIMSIAIMHTAYRTPPCDLDYLIVLGAQVRPSGEPSVVLRYRLAAARNYLDENPRTRVVVSGGQGPNEPCSEGEAMARWLERAGIDADRIVVESESKTTVENLQSVADLTRRAAARGAPAGGAQCAGARCALSHVSPRGGRERTARRALSPAVCPPGPAPSAPAA